MIFAKYAPRYAAQGFLVFPLARGSKEPTAGSHGLNDATCDMQQIKRWGMADPYSNIGLKTGAASGVDVIDVDPEKGGFGTVAALRKEGKCLPSGAIASTRSGGRHIFVRHDPLIRTGTNRLGPGIDFRGEGGYVVVAPSIVDGKLYRWLCWPGKDNMPLPPKWLIDQLRARQVERSSRPLPPLENLPDAGERVRDALQYISSDGYDEWVKVGMAIRAELGEKGRPLWDKWSSKSQKFDDEMQERKWHSFRGNGVGLGTIFDLRRGGRVQLYEL